MKKQVLIIDSNLEVCKEIRYALQSDTTDACYAGSVKNALALFTKQKFCLVIMDILLAETDGLVLQCAAGKGGECSAERI